MSVPIIPVLSRNPPKIRVPFGACRQPAAPVATGPTVLAVDDSAVLLEVMFAILSEAGFNVLTSTRGTKGLELLQHAGAAVQVVLLDYQMPVINGAQLLPWVRRLAPAARVVGISGADPAELPLEFRTGVDQLLPKPFTRSELIGAVAALLPAANPALNCRQGRLARQQSVGLPIAAT